MIKWHHCYIATRKDQSQRHGYTMLDCPPQLPFLYIGFITSRGRRDRGSIFFRFRTGPDPINHVKSAHLLATPYDTTWGQPIQRFFGSTLYNQSQITSRHDFDTIPKTKAYVDYSSPHWEKDRQRTIDLTPILREQHQLGLLTPNTWIGFVAHDVRFAYDKCVYIYTLDPSHTNEMSLHISSFLDVPGPSDPPPNPEISQPPNDPLLPPVFTAPYIPPDRAMTLEAGLYWGQNKAHVVAHTDQDCLMKLLWTDVPPEEHKKPDLRRGRVFRWDKKYCFVSWNEIPEENPLPSHYHDFCWPDWANGDTKYYRYAFIFNGEQIKPNTPFYWDSYPGDSAWNIPPEEGAPILLPASLTEEGLPCFGPILQLYDPFTWGGMEPPDFELLFTEVYTWLGDTPPAWTQFFTEHWT